MKKILLFFTVLITSTTVFGQLVVNTGMTPQQYVEDVLIGSGVTVSNVTYTGATGSNSQIGQFNGTASNIGFNGGILLSSAAATYAANGSGSDDLFGAGDAGVLQVAQSINAGITESNDAAILEFDFVPTSNVVNFNFVFGSDEYLTWINSIYNDAFAFFVSGPGISGPYPAPAAYPNGAANLAVVPGTSTPITISTIYPPISGFPAGMNSEYYIQNSGNTHTLNGFTTPIPVSFNVFCDSTYHFKFVVADCSDGTLNTAVFLEQNSFTSPPVNFAITGPDGGTGVTTIVEGCSDPATVWFTRSLCQSGTPITVNYTIGGTATQGTDYDPLTNPIFLAAGEDSASVQINALADALTEGLEYVQITYSYLNENNETVTTSGTIAISDPVAVTANAGADQLLHCEGTSANVSVTASAGPGETFTYSWQPGGQTTPSFNTGPLDNGVYTYIVTVTNACGLTDRDTVVITQNQTLGIDTILIFNATGCGNMDGAVSAIVEGQIGVVDYNWTGGGFNTDASVLQNIPAGSYTFTATDDYCTIDTTVQVNQDPPPVAVINPSTDGGCSPIDATFANGSQNAISYKWDLGNGQIINTNDLSSQSATYTDDAVIQLIAYGNGNCSDTTTVTISVAVCGCMDPIAINYNPLAVISDGSCIYPVPTAVVPNVFTPDKDAINDFFEIRTTNAVNIEFTIVDRWGNEVYSASGTAPKWDGKSNGNDSDEGVYFYTYTVTGIAGDELEGQGFVQLFRE